MIKSIYIDNFKALNDFKIEFQPLTVLIGANSVGKSTVLQALELLAYFTKGKEHGELNNYLKDNGWSAKDLKSNFSRKKHTKFVVAIIVEEVVYQWKVVLEAKGNKFILIQESIISDKGDLLLTNDEDALTLKSKAGNKIQFSPNSVTSSALSFINEEKITEELKQIKRSLNGLALFDFSSTNHLKSTNILVDKATIGRYGENLAAYLYQIDKIELEKLSKAIKEYVPFFEDIRIKKIRGKEVEIDIREHFNKKYIDALHLSDGMMRLLAILALALTESGYQTIMIEEIEDGIHPNLAGEVIKTLLKITESTNQQFILTTHNPLMLDWTPVESIHHLHRNEEGQVEVKTFKDDITVMQNLDYMNPGEIWLNFEEEILKKDENK
jgi:predicted ATPase